MEPLRLGIAGLGTVGGGLLELIKASGDTIAQRAGRQVVITGVSARDRAKIRAVSLKNVTWFDDPVALAKSPDIDVLVELIGGDGDPAKSALEAALANGKHVVTANKALIARHGNALARIAEKSGVALNFEAAVAGGIPIVKTLREALAGNSITRLYGIMNGTSNFILTKMEQERRSFADVLGEAQQLGYAEADPTFDIGGFDTAHKLAILTALAFGTELDVESIYIEGIDQITLQDINIAGELGFRIKLLGVSVQTEAGIEQRVHPTLVPKDSPIADVHGVFNAVAVSGDFVGELMLEGRGAGAHPTASSVMSDIIDIARGHIQKPFGVPVSALQPYRTAEMPAHEGGYYVTMTLQDRPGAVAAVAQRMAEQNISIDSIIQRPALGASVDARGKPPTDVATRPVILITHDTHERNVREALSRIESDRHTVDRPRMIRIEKLK
ncbi:homoserine dehydrogenase [Rhodoligotrophos appendicifer]|uniref:homoserine dehydrogenase n=1 Tax=Rhodoligotrophos appendicifer TaxID=987056 RepID=UPI0011861FEE|nr:homoserine dehydrogenase [Rhodoligotrophos appendicifer]